MPRRLKQDERFMRWAQERSQLFLALRNATIPVKLQAYKQLEKRILTEARSEGEKREMQRRISMDLLMAASDGSWRGFSPYLRRVERLGYSSMFDRLVACVLAAEAAKGSAAGVRKALLLIAQFERRLRGRKLHPGVRDEFEGGLARARKLLGLEARPPLRGRH
jgi:hypothetical protein